MLAVKNLPANAGDKRETGLILGWGRSLAGGNGNPLQYSCLENTMDRGAYSPQGCKELNMTEVIRPHLLKDIAIAVKFWQL